MSRIFKGLDSHILTLQLQHPAWLQKVGPLLKLLSERQQPPWALQDTCLVVSNRATAHQVIDYCTANRVNVVTCKILDELWTGR